jgi:hypothetical protein
MALPMLLDRSVTHVPGSNLERILGETLLLEQPRHRLAGKRLNVLDTRVTLPASPQRASHSWHGLAGKPPRAWARRSALPASARRAWPSRQSLAGKPSRARPPRKRLASKPSAGMARSKAPCVQAVPGCVRSKAACRQALERYDRIERALPASHRLESPLAEACRQAMAGIEPLQSLAGKALDGNELS